VNSSLNFLLRGKIIDNFNILNAQAVAASPSPPKTYKKLLLFLYINWFLLNNCLESLHM